MDAFQKLMFQQTTKHVSEPVYCRYCGQNIKEPSAKSTKFATGIGTGTWYSEWEIQNHAHIKCARAHY